MKLDISESGDANVYTIITKNTWLMHIRFNGELLTSTHKYLLEELIKSLEGAMKDENG